jgi:membrane protein implicated in regulation of membrane protease activity
LLVAILLAVFVLDERWGLAAIAGGGAIEIGEAWFWWRWTHRRRPVVGVEALVGAIAEVVEPCFPDGWVRVGGELWRASCDAGADVGAQVRVLVVDGLTLIVSP